MSPRKQNPVVVVSIALFDLLGYLNVGAVWDLTVPMKTCLFTKNIYIYISLKTTELKRDTCYISCQIFQATLGPKSFFPSFLYIAVLLPFVSFSPLLIFWEILSSTKKQSKNIFFCECQHMPLLWEVTQP